MKSPFHDYLYNQHLQLIEQAENDQIFDGLTTWLFSRFTAGVVIAMGCESIFDYGSGSGALEDKNHQGHQNIRALCGEQFPIFGYEPSMKKTLKTNNLNSFLPFQDDTFDVVMFLSNYLINTKMVDIG